MGANVTLAVAVVLAGILGFLVGMYIGLAHEDTDEEPEIERFAREQEAEYQRRQGSRPTRGGF